MEEENDIKRRCVELGTFLAATGRPFSFLVTMEGFKLELESSRLASPPQYTRVANRPNNRTDPPPPRTNRGGDTELQSSKKRVGPSRSRRNSRRWQAHLLSKRRVSPLPAPRSATGGGQTSEGRVVEGLELGEQFLPLDPIQVPRTGSLVPETDSRLTGS